MSAIAFDKGVFINCPFDTSYKPIFDAIVFAIHDLGFQARFALLDDDTAIRLTRITNDIFASKYSIHDVSRVEVGAKNKLPRFNMPFEAGIAFAAHQIRLNGNDHNLLFLDSMPYRYQASMSDIAGLDPKSHDNDPNVAIACVRSFISRKSGNRSLPGSKYIQKRYSAFLTRLTHMASKQRISVREIKSWDYAADLQAIMADWIIQNPP